MSTRFAAIEVSRDELLVLTEHNGRRLRAPRRYGNTPEGHRKLVAWLTRGRCPEVRVVLETTGTYGFDLAVTLAQTPRVAVWAPNPWEVRRFAQALGERHKTDVRDVHVLLEYGRRMAGRPWQPPPERWLALRALTRRIAQLVRLQTQERNRLAAYRATRTTPEAVLQATEETVRQLEETIARLRSEAHKVVAADEELARAFALLVSIRGVGEKTALRVLGEWVAFPKGLTASQWVKLAGLHPRQHESGRSVSRRKGIGKQGNRYLREALFMPAVVAARWSPPLREFAARLEKRGLKRIQAIIAVMRRLLVIMHAVLTHGEPYDERKVYPRHRLRETERAA